MVESLVIEAIQAKGADVKYMVRELVNRDPLFGEATLSSFEEYAEVEMYLADIQNFNGDGDMFGKFGFTMTDSANFEVSVKRFQQELGRYGLDRPREGDLIYYGLNDSLYEIRKVSKDSQFNKLGRNYVHRLQCSLFQWSHEKLPKHPDMDTFNDKEDIVLSSEDMIDIGKTLGISPNSQKDERPSIKEEGSKYMTFDPANPFKV